jgi:ribose 5-phosphate isomerase B
MERIAIGSDHAARELKDLLAGYLRERGYQVLDAGPRDPGPVDYTETGRIVAGQVAGGEADRGLLLCGTGLGMTIVANKFPGIRACLCHDAYSARMSRAHNDANVLVMGGRVIAWDLARDITAIWLATPFEGGRHALRLSKISALEEVVHHANRSTNP